MGLKAKSAIGFIIFFFIGLIVSNVTTTANSAENNVTTGDWPTSTWKTASPESQGMSSEELAEMVNLVWKSDLSIDSIAIVRNGYLVLDAYNHTQTVDTSHIIYSCTKSIVSALVGIAIDKGYIKGVDQTVLSFFPNMRFKNLTEDKKSMTLEHLLTMSTGLKCRDSYLYEWRGLYDMVPSDDWIQFMLDLPMSETPGSRFEYCNGASFLLSAIIQQSTGITALEFAKKHLFGPLGITNITWPENRQGITIGYSEIRMRPRDMARIGQLFLNKGVWNGKQIVSSEWVKESTRQHVSTTTLPGYGYQWWVAGPGVYTALGHQGQYIMVHPEKKLVIVFTSYLTGISSFTPLNLLNNFILPAIKSDGPIPENDHHTKALQSIVKLWQTETYYTYKQGDTASEEPIVREYINKDLGLSIKYDPKQFNTEAAVIPPIIFSRKHITGLPTFSILTDNIPQGLTLETAENYTIGLLKKFLSASDFTIRKKEIIVLEDGTKAGYSELYWRYQSMNLLTVSAYAIKGDKLIGVIVSNAEEKPIEFLSNIARSLKFNK